MSSLSTAELRELLVAREAVDAAERKAEEEREAADLEREERALAARKQALREKRRGKEEAAKRPGEEGAEAKTEAAEPDKMASMEATAATDKGTRSRPRPRALKAKADGVDEDDGVVMGKRKASEVLWCNFFFLCFF